MEISRTRIQAMTGRDPNEVGRATTPLELLYDLCFAVAFGIAGNQFAIYFSGHHYLAALGGFSFAVFAICWAWIQFSWFASAFDTDDWFYRVTVMIQMVGVVIVALGLPSAFASIQENQSLDITVTVSGYVVIRMAQLVNWARIFFQAPALRSLCRRYITSLIVSQSLWVLFAIAHLKLQTAAWALPVLIALETLGPIFGEGRGEGTPWHTDHITERFSALAIITLGEGVVGTVASAGAAEAGVSWTWEPIVLIITGLLLVFGIWWIYFAIPWSEAVSSRPQRRFIFSYGHILILGSIAATGAALQIAGYNLEGTSEHVSAAVVATVLAAAVGIYVASLYAVHALVSGTHEWANLMLLALTGLIVVGGVSLVTAGLDLPWGLLIISTAPLVTVMGLRGSTRGSEAVS
jgi:low temperature requirement protein LtrA